MAKISILTTYGHNPISRLKMRIKVAKIAKLAKMILQINALILANTFGHFSHFKLFLATSLIVNFSYSLVYYSSYLLIISLQTYKFNLTANSAVLCSHLSLDRLSRFSYPLWFFLMFYLLRLHFLLTL